MSSPNAPSLSVDSPAPRKYDAWTLFLVVWLIVVNAAILAISVVQGDSLVGIGAALTGVTFVVLCGMGKTSSYFFGLVNIILYAIVAWKAKYYGDFMLNVLYYLPTNIAGWFMWRKSMDAETGTVCKRRLTLKNNLFLAALCVVCVCVYGLFLKRVGGNLPFVDSVTTVLSVFGQFLLIKRYIEHWIIWIVVDVVSVVMWVYALNTEGESVATLLMWIVFTMNGFIMFFKWRCDMKRQKISDES
jgi:nicotinamide mononucleotide transporter